MGAPRTARPSSLVDTRIIYCGDNLERLRTLPDECVDLSYIDPPFNSNRNYEVFWGETKEKRAFEDRHASTQAYIEFMRPRCVELHRVLKTTGCFYFHCDWHASHYVKSMLDQIFGENQFCNEIIWKRRQGSSQLLNRSMYGVCTDSIFFYAKGPDYTFETPYSFAAKGYDDYVKKFFRHTDANGRKFRIDNLANPALRPNLIYEYKGYKPPKNGWAISKEKMEQWDKEGRLYFPKNPDGRIQRKRFLDELKGKPVQNLWDDIEPISSQAAERLGYPTQKPLALLERIIKASSNENDVVLDAFCGCGTALVAAENLKRQWIGIDFSPTACRVMAKRLRDVCKLPEDEKLWHIGRGFVVRGLPWSEEQLRKIPPFEFENWAVIALGGLPNKAQVGDMGIDGRIYPVTSTPKKAGADTLAFMDNWYPIQVKQKDKAGRPDIDSFEAVMHREDRAKGFFVSFDFSSDALTEVDHFFRKSGKVIIPLTVKEILEEQIAKKLA